MYVKCTIRKEDGTVLLDDWCGVPTEFSGYRLPRFALVCFDKTDRQYRQCRWFLYENKAKQALADDNARLDPTSIWGPEDIGTVEYELVKEKGDK